MIIELISRLNVPNIESIQTKTQLYEYMTDIVETNLVPFFSQIYKRTTPKPNDSPLCWFKLVELTATK
jgi:hypothetical protein